MADDRYYQDQPRFSRRDPLDRWSWIFLGIAAAALIWFLVVIFLFGTNRLEDDTLFGRGEGFWVGLSTVAVILALLGLIFVIVGRLGATTGGGYLSADAEEPETARARTTGRTATADDDDEVLGLPERPGAPPPGPRTPARIDDPFGPDGRMLLSYTVPEQQPRGIYGDTWVPVDGDAVLNVKSLLAKTSGGNRP